MKMKQRKKRRVRKNTIDGRRAFIRYAQKTLAIAARAERDVKVESAIKNFEEVWLSKLFDLTKYQRSYPTTRAEVCVYSNE